MSDHLPLVAEFELGLTEPLRRPTRARHRAAVGLERAARRQFIGGNRVRLLTGGDELFPGDARGHRRGAAIEVWLATYIFHDDRRRAASPQALRAAAQRGVQVHVVVDGFGSHGHAAAA